MSDERLVLGEDAVLDSPPTVQPQVEDDDNAEPEGVVEINGQRMVPASAISAIRKTAKERAANAVRKNELSAVQQQLQQREAELQQLTGALNESRPYIERLRARPELMRDPDPTPEEQKVSDGEAETFARRYELYKAGTGEFDTSRAKGMIADQRREMVKYAQEAAAAAVQPLAKMTAEQRSQHNFVQMANERDEHGRPLIDAQELAKKWNEFPREITADPNAAQVIRDAVLGQMVRTGKRVTSAPPEREPVFSEASGGRGGPGFQMNDVFKKFAHASGMSEKEFKAGATKYQPGTANVIGGE
jgi:hypothetical protein